MKFRTDFVTNSSSSSFLSCFVSIIGERLSRGVFYEVEDWELRDIPFSRDNDGVSCWGYKIKAFDELLACLYFYGVTNESDDCPKLDRATVPIIVSAFLFLASKISFSEMVSEIKKTIYGENKEYDEWLKEKTWLEDSRISWRESDEVQELQDMDPEDYDEEDFSELVKTSFRNIFENDDLFTDVEENALFDLAHQNISLSDVSWLTFSENGEKHGEFLSGEDDDFKEKYQSVFPKISKTDPLFEKVKNKWLKLIEETYGSDIDLIGELEIDDALETGEIDKVWVNYVAYQERDEDFFFNAKPQEQHNTAKEKIQEAIMSFCNFPDEYSYNILKGYIEKNSSEVIKVLDDESLISEEYNVFRILEFKDEQENPKLLKLLVQNNKIPKSFTEYPITDLLDKALEYEYTEYLGLLLNTGLELDYNDIAHYIYNDTLETLYPLFDRGLKIDSSAYDDLTNYASEQGKPEYTAWLLNRKNEAA